MADVTTQYAKHDQVNLFNHTAAPTAPTGYLALYALSGALAFNGQTVLTRAAGQLSATGAVLGSTDTAFEFLSPTTILAGMTARTTTAPNADALIAPVAGTYLCYATVSAEGPVNQWNASGDSVTAYFWVGTTAAPFGNTTLTATVSIVTLGSLAKITDITTNTDDAEAVGALIAMRTLAAGDAVGVVVKSSYATNNTGVTFGMFRVG